MNLSPLGDSAVVAVLGTEINESTLDRVQSLVQEIARARIPGILDVVPAYATVTVYYEPARFASAGARPYPTVAQFVLWCAARAGNGSAVPPSAREVEIPVCYGGEFGPDLAEVAAHCELRTEEVVERHCGALYRVHAIGFAPGFPYLGGLPVSLHTPRRTAPRALVAAGSVGIGGEQTGIYSLATPGGWQIVGRTPVSLFEPRRPEPSLLRAGDRLRFRRISPEEFASWK